MNLAILVEVFALLLLKSLSLDDATPGPISNITVMGTVFCDACSDNCFTKHSYFLKDVAVRVDCMFRVNSTSKEEISITVDRTTDRFGVYKLDIPPVDGFECKEGRQIDSFCRASLIGSPPTICSSPGLTTSTEHVSVKCNEDSVCLYNLNALYYRPGKKDSNLCGTTNREKMSSSSSSNLNTSLFFWPPFPPFGFPWPHWSPIPFPFPSPPSLPFPFPPLPFLTPPPPSFPFPFPPLPFFTPPPPSFPFPFPPLPPIPSFFPSPPPPSFPFPPLPPLPSWFTPPPPPPSPPPPSFPFPFPPIPPITPIPSWFASPPPPPSPPPPSPPPPSLPFPFPPFPFPPFPPLTRTPPKPSPPPSTFSLRDPRSWLPSHLPSSSKQP
ncbi:uncharacterized protein [Typha latifolia]|uniref:uncharacterized protein isoform X2 n=1 Tax=Typha latifolia TaxID=4733 RepID=UPI003C30026D